MDMMAIRRRVLMSSGKKVIDTSPKIAEYGKYCNRTGQGLDSDSAWCYTEYYDLEFNGRQTIHDNNTDSQHTMQFQTNAQGTAYDFWYGPSRTVGAYNVIRFSIKMENIDTSYAYSEKSGQIFFAGKNTPYYGYTNINDMPT